MRVSILIMALRPPLRALTSASSAELRCPCTEPPAASCPSQEQWPAPVTPELISKASSINHGSGSLLLGETSLVGHLIKISLQLVVLGLQLPAGSGNGLVDVAQLSEVLVGVSQLLLSSASLSVSSLKKSAALLQSVLHGSSLPVS